MPRTRLFSVVLAGVVCSLAVPSAQAEEAAATIGNGLIQLASGQEGPKLLVPPAPGTPRKIVPAKTSKPIPARRASFITDAAKLPVAIDAKAAAAKAQPLTTIPPGGTGHGYVKLDAPLYPTPVPWVPHQVGGTYITNQAFAPHEMLWAHKYKAMYPPFYYRVRGGWMITPRGIWSHENWKLLGTTVRVRYSSRLPLTFQP